ncbi:MAG: hypothetical protein AVDCRST_MAG22-888 [uncultured Rubrobacteraceae bacterium]|uniref:Uncharacterized protein n=1 Tax=uncultured Rubrobacteraceae bacterium TaxID=349277 RepID=A0A6J4NZ94_9ACTN|nr:MAG: hypothetical protein AVDCRST_MAG22-888 [uncultured Rubrobacteraceae bacterium]
MAKGAKKDGELSGDAQAGTRRRGRAGGDVQAGTCRRGTKDYPRGET